MEEPGHGAATVARQSPSDHLLRCAWSYLRVTVSDPIPLIRLLSSGSWCCPSEALRPEALAAVGGQEDWLAGCASGWRVPAQQ